MRTIYSIFYYLLIGLLSWIIGVLALSRYIRNKSALVLGSIAVGIAAILIMYCVNIRKQPKKNKILKHNKELQQLKDYLLFTPMTQKIIFLKEVLSEQNYKKSTNNKYLYAEKSIILPIFNKQVIDINDILDAISVYSNKFDEITILCLDYNHEILNNISKYNKTIRIIDLKEFYSTYIENKISIPAAPVNTATKTNINWSSIKQTMFNEDNWKKYLALGFCVLTFGIFNRQRIYFVVFTVLFWILSIVTLSKKLFKKNK